VIREERLAERAAAEGAYFLSRLLDVQREFPALIAEVRGRGLLVGLEFHHEDIAGLVISGMGRRRVIVGYYLSNPRVFRFEPPLIVSRAEIDTAVTAFRASIRETLELVEGLELE